jgi:hypothetical protein
MGRGVNIEYMILVIGQAGKVSPRAVVPAKYSWTAIRPWRATQEVKCAWRA